MKLALLQRELKIFSKAILSLIKLGDDIYFEWNNNELSIRSVNSSRSAFGLFTFQNDFFEKILEPYDSQMLCKLSSKPCLAIFKITSTNKSVERCKITLNKINNNMIVQLFCQNDICKIYDLKLMDTGNLQARYSVQSATNVMISSTKLLLDVLNNFQNSLEEIMITIDSKQFIMHSHLGEIDPSKTVSTKINLELDDFDEYDIGNTLELILCLKELKAALSFGELVGCTVRITFSVSGRPMIFNYNHFDDKIQAHFVLSTISTGNNTPNISTSTVNSSLARRIQKSRNVTRTTTSQFGENEDEDDQILSQIDDFDEVYAASTGTYPSTMPNTDNETAISTNIDSTDRFNESFTSSRYESSRNIPIKLRNQNQSISNYKTTSECSTIKRSSNLFSLYENQTAQLANQQTAFKRRRILGESNQLDFIGLTESSDLLNSTTQLVNDSDEEMDQ